MSELAFNINGEAFEVPANATGWRVRRMRAKGAPEVVYGRDGLPLVLPISAQMEELRSEVDTTGRYRLDPVDADNKAITGVPSGYVHVNFEAAPASSEADEPQVSTASFSKPTDHVVLESMRMQSMIAVAVVERFPQMMEAAATLLRAADGAGLPARPPMALLEDGEDDDADGDEPSGPKPGGGLDVGALIMQAAPLLLAFAGGKLKLPDLLNWNKAAAKGQESRSEAAREPTTREPAPKTGAATAEASVAQQIQSDPAAMQHFLAILSALTPAERALGQALAGELSAGERAAWLAELKALSVEDAVAKVRVLLGDASKNGGAA